MPRSESKWNKYLICLMCFSSGHVAFGDRGEEPSCSCRPDPGHTCLPRPQQTQPQRAAHTETGIDTHMYSAFCVSNIYTVLEMQRHKLHTHSAWLQLHSGITHIHSSYSPTSLHCFISACWWKWKASSSR